LERLTLDLGHGEPGAHSLPHQLTLELGDAQNAQAGRKILLNLRNVTCIDSSGIGELVGAFY